MNCKWDWTTIKNKHKNKRIWFLCVLVGLLIYLLYFYRFNSGFSYNSSDWSAFGNYVSGISSIVNVILFVYISIMLHRLTRKDSAETKIYESLNNCIELVAITRIHILDLKNEILIESDVYKLIKESISEIYMKHSVLNSKINTYCADDYLSSFSTPIKEITTSIVDMLNLIYKHQCRSSKTDDTWKDDIRDMIESVNTKYNNIRDLIFKYFK